MGLYKDQRQALKTLRKVVLEIPPKGTPKNVIIVGMLTEHAVSRRFIEQCIYDLEEEGILHVSNDGTVTRMTQESMTKMNKTVQEIMDNIKASAQRVERVDKEQALKEFGAIVGDPDQP